MTSLLRVFQSVPAVVRKRAKELLDTIRQCVRENLPSEAIDDATDPSVHILEETEVSKSTVAEPISPKDNVAESSLWSNGAFISFHRGQPIDVHA
jgi:exosome complex exonuclease RRP6